ncbi:hypothetical protein SCLARK_00630 [Spiroplasma clarkii]|nr:hypothetical protein SCLARK_00630 [Spiroplasma clarkii]
MAKLIKNIIKVDQAVIIKMFKIHNIIWENNILILEISFESVKYNNLLSLQ